MKITIADVFAILCVLFLTLAVILDSAFLMGLTLFTLGLLIGMFINKEWR